MRNTNANLTRMALSDVTNHGNTGQSSARLIEESKWREVILEYYRNNNISVTKFLRERGLLHARHRFDQCWHDSGLKSMKEAKLGRNKAALQYDAWSQQKQAESVVGESEWRRHILSYYLSKDKSIAKFLKEINLTKQKDKFYRRWKLSRLNDAKVLNLGYDAAIRQYDEWFNKWRKCKVAKNKSNLFTIYVDVNATEDDGEVKATAQAAIRKDEGMVRNERTHNDMHQAVMEEGINESDGYVPYERTYSGARQVATVMEEGINKSNVRFRYEHNCNGFGQAIIGESINESDGKVLYERTYNGMRQAGTKCGIIESDGKVLYECTYNGMRQAGTEVGIIERDGTVLYDCTYNGMHQAVMEEGIIESDGKVPYEENIRNSKPKSALTGNADISNNDGDRNSYCNGTVLRNNRASKLSKKEIKEVLIQYYLCKEDVKLLTFIKQNGYANNKNAIQRHWRESGLKEMKLASKPLPDAISLYDRWRSTEKTKEVNKNRQNGRTLKVFPDDLEVFMNGLIKQMALCGQGIGKKILRELFEQSLVDFSITKGRTFSRSTLDRFIKSFDLECKAVKNIDPVRIAQVTPENRDAFFFRLDQIVSLIHNVDPINCPWKSWREVDSQNIDNMDEMGTDNTRFRDTVLIPKEITHRIFQATPEGDRAKTHVTLAVFSKSNGHYKDRNAGIEGAPLPMVIHTKVSSSSKEKGGTPIEKRMALYENSKDDIVTVGAQYTEGFSPKNPLDITVRTSSNGSMTKEVFFDAMLYYVKNLAPEQGPQGKYVFLLLDSHVSRWNPKALYTLFKHRVIPIFFPSHLSIVCQPQDNGVIFFLHKCIENASLLERLFTSESGIAHANNILERAFYTFRDEERKKLIDHGSNSTTRSYRMPGIKPCNPFSPGWRENLELYASFNGLRMSSDACPYYGVKPKNKSLCRDFSDAEIQLLNEAMPVLARDADGTNTILDDPKAKCYSIANRIVNDWVEKPSDEHAVRPHPTSAVERLALEHMEITHIVTAEPSESSEYLESVCQQRKKDAILYQTLPMETIQVKPKEEVGIIVRDGWYKATKMARKLHTWSVFDGESTKEVSTVDLEENWEIDLQYDLFPDDKTLKKRRDDSDVRRRKEKDAIIKRLAEKVAEEEREAELQRVFRTFMADSDRSFASFKERVVSFIERPSNHTVTVALGSEEEHAVKVCAHGYHTSSMKQIVIDNVCQTIVRGYKREKKTNRRRGGRVNRTRRGSDGFVKIAQIDEQHQLDVLEQRDTAQKTKNAKVDLCKRRLLAIRKFATIPRYLDLWNKDGLLISDSKHMTKQHMISLLKAFNVEGRTKLATGSKESIQQKVQTLRITQEGVEEMEISLINELESFGESDDFDLDQSFCNDSFQEDISNKGHETDTSVGNIESDDSKDANEPSQMVAVNRSVCFDDSPTIRILPYVNDELSSSTDNRPSIPTRRSSRRQKKQVLKDPEPKTTTNTRIYPRRTRKKTWKLQD